MCASILVMGTIVGVSTVVGMAGGAQFRRDVDPNAFGKCKTR
jgi:hypothetical protein